MNNTNLSKIKYDEIIVNKKESKIKNCDETLTINIKL